MKTVATTVFLLGVFGGVLMGCASVTADRGAACDQAVAQAMAIDPGSDTVSAVDGAIAGCASLEASFPPCHSRKSRAGSRPPTCRPRPKPDRNFRCVVPIATLHAP